MNYAFSPDQWMRIFAIPSSVAENYLRLASGNAIKVLLFIAYHNDRTYTIPEISAELGISEEMTEEALIFWKNAGVLTDGKAVAVQPTVTAPVTAEPVKESRPTTVRRPEKELTPKEIAERISASEDITFLFSKAEECYGRVLTHTDHRSLIWIHDYIGLPTEIIIMLMEFCKIHGKLTASYMDKVAGDWADRDITTIERAEAEFTRITEMTSFTGKVRSILGINGRNLSTSEKKHIGEWYEKNYNLGLIEYAYDKTIDATGKLSLAYLNKILINWAEKGITDRATAENETNPTKTDNSDKPVYDFDMLENLALNTSSSDT